MSKRGIVIFHLLYWFYFVFVGAMGNLIQRNTGFDFTKFITQPLLYTGLFVAVFTFYINYFLFLPRFFKQNKYILFVVLMLVLFLFYSSLRYLVEEIIAKYFIGHGNYNEGFSLSFYFFDNLYWASSPIFTSTILWLLSNYFDSEKEKKQILQEKQNAEISFLKSQINPHFIFNTLNNIYSLVYQKSDKALIALEKFSSLLRYITIESEKDKTYLGNEIKYIESLISLESLRIANANIIFEKDIDDENLIIPSLLLIPFIENGFKHGEVSNVVYPFLISLVVKEAKLEFKTENKTSKKLKDEANGIGLQNTKRRLELMYPNSHKLEIYETETDFKCHLTITL
jgi:two-component system, LytTR family, sensor kinase